WAFTSSAAIIAFANLIVAIIGRGPRYREFRKACFFSVQIFLLAVAAPMVAGALLGRRSAEDGPLSVSSIQAVAPLASEIVTGICYLILLIAAVVSSASACIVAND